MMSAAAFHAHTLSGFAAGAVGVILAGDFSVIDVVPIGGFAAWQSSGAARGGNGHEHTEEGVGHHVSIV